MLVFKPVTLEDKEIIENYLESEYITSSELTYTTMLIWQNYLKIMYAECDDCLIFYTKDGNNPASLRWPIGRGNKKNAVLKVIAWMKENGEDGRFYGLTEENKREIINLFGNNLQFVEMTDYFDYVYETEKLINLPGKKLHSKKNHLNNFIKSYNFSFIEADENDAEIILSAYDNWFTTDDESLIAERKGIEVVLKNLTYLGLKCCYLKVDDEVCAFSIGQQINPDTAVIHIEKANTDYKGAYAAINQMFVKNCFSEYKYINREEDCGIEGLRKAKLSYHPAFMINKYKTKIEG